MKYRVRLDLSFADGADAQSLMAYAKNLSSLTVSINEDEVNEEMTVTANWHLCRHDSGLPCEVESEI